MPIIDQVTSPDKIYLFDLDIEYMQNLKRDMKIWKNVTKRLFMVRKGCPCFSPFSFWEKAECERRHMLEVHSSGPTRGIMTRDNSPNHGAMPPWIKAA